ncbi:hypothetical protein J2X31_001284 [Flavobacterium arsenatis]|uniref:PDZ domain-containing protein n=1 Tax=Flavobacterium arsenatis TaxID=1484332 RepID=A0ABU1TMT6_9FLAO|nr:aspartyl protease family protein [Flavobacterium arsenatis]MDR6967277.1 hypothetical protein [Flavobacterium arsenatis]
MRKSILLLSLVFLVSCGKNLLPTGTIKQQGFTETIPFNFDNGLPLIQVQIAGVHYNFLLDTGAPTVISQELAAVLKSKTIKKSLVGDSQGNDGKQEFILIDEIKIGKLHFNDIGAVVINLKEAFEIKCLELDGIIGSNQMSNAIWEIDYKNKNITITDNFIGFKEPEASSKLHFIEMGDQKTPLVKVQVDSVRSKLLTFDTGANGSISLPYLHFKNTVKDYKQIKNYGSPSSGVYGAGKKDTVIVAKVPFMKVGSFELEDQFITFENSSSSLIGNGFLRNYKTTINWKNKTIYLQKQDTIKSRIIESFGFAIRYINYKPVVATLFQNSNAEKSGLQLGDEIIEIDGTPFTELTEEQACHYTLNSVLGNKKEIELTFIRNNQKQDVKIFSSILLE